MEAVQPAATPPAPRPAVPGAAGPLHPCGPEGRGLLGGRSPTMMVQTYYTEWVKESTASTWRALQSGMEAAAAAASGGGSAAAVSMHERAAPRPQRQLVLPLLQLELPPPQQPAGRQWWLNPRGATAAGRPPPASSSADLQSLHAVPRLQQACGGLCPAMPGMPAAVTALLPPTGMSNKRAAPAGGQAAGERKKTKYACAPCNVIMSHAHRNVCPWCQKCNGKGRGVPTLRVNCAQHWPGLYAAAHGQQQSIADMMVRAGQEGAGAGQQGEEAGEEGGVHDEGGGEYEGP